MKTQTDAEKIDSTSPKPDCAAKTYLIEVSFDLLANPHEREHFLSLPTSFDLKDKDVDRLNAVARRLLNHSDEFQRLVTDLQPEF